MNNPEDPLQGILVDQHQSSETEYAERSIAIQAHSTEERNEIEMDEYPTVTIPRLKRRFCQRVATLLQLAWAPNSVLLSLQLQDHRFPRVTLPAVEALMLMPPIDDVAIENSDSPHQNTQASTTLARSPSFPNFYIQSTALQANQQSSEMNPENDTQAHSPYVATMLRHAMYQIANYDLLPDVLVCAACIYVRRAYASDRSLQVSGSLLLRRFLAASAIAAKMWQDEPFNLATFAILGSIPVAELGYQEVEMIAILRGKLTLDRDFVLQIHRLLTSE